MDIIKNLEEIEKIFFDNLDEIYLIHYIMYEYADLYTKSINLVKEEIYILYKNNNRLRMSLKLKSLKRKLRKMPTMFNNSPKHRMARKKIYEEIYILKNLNYSTIELNRLKIEKRRKVVKKLEFKRTKTFDLLGKKMYD
jgi:hypothetical protein